MDITMHRAPSAAPVAGGQCRFGAAVIDITPTPGLAMAGYSVDGHVSRGTLGRLFTRAFYLEDARGEAAALCTIDLLSGTRYLLDCVARLCIDQGLSLSADRIIISGTHTHTAPGHCFANALYDWFAQKLDGFDEQWADWLSRRIALAIAQAKASSVVAKIATAQIPVWHIAHNRSIEAFENCPEIEQWRSAGFPGETAPADLPPDEVAVDPRLFLLAGYDAASGKVIGVHATMGCHSTSMGPGFDCYCADWPGVACRTASIELLKIQAQRPVVAFASGATGDASPLRSRGLPAGRPLAREVGRKLAGVVVDAVQTLQPTDFTLDIWFAEPATAGNAIPPGNEQTRLAADWAFGAPTIGGADDGRSALFELGLVREGVTGNDFPADDPQHPKTRGPLLPIVQHFFERFAHAQPAPVFPLHVLKLNDHAIATVPGEPTAVAAWRIEQRVLQRLGLSSCTVLGYAGDYAGYLTTPEEYETQQYEGASTLWGRNTVPFLAAALEELVSLPPQHATQGKSFVLKTGRAVNLFKPPSADAAAVTVEPRVKREGPVVSISWAMPRNMEVLFAEGYFVRLQVGDQGAWKDLLVESVPFDDVERLIQVERIDNVGAALAEHYLWRIEILLSDQIPAAAKLRAVVPKRNGFAGFAVEIPA
jgi:neutral ceramidase